MRKKIILFPFAGASFYSYRPFEGQCPKDVELLALEAPGRGKRITENFPEDIFQLADDFYTQLSEFINDSADFYFFGHSLGAVLALLVTQKLQSEKQTLPKKLVLSGKNPPHIKSQISNRHLLSDSDFKNLISDMGGTPKEILQNKDLLDYFLPILRADFSLVDKVKFDIPDQKPELPVKILSGDTDRNTDKESLADWNFYFKNKPHYEELEGDHFFIFNNIEQIYNSILENV